MRVWKGIVLVGAIADKECVKGGTRYYIIDIVGKTGKLDQISDEDEEFSRSFEMAQGEIGEKLLLSHGVTYDSSQARTTRGPLRLIQVDHKC